MSRVLIVDDSPTEMHILSGILEQQGYTILSAVDGEKGVVAAREEQPDLILMDVVMPGMNGFQATRLLSRDEATKHIPIIIVTTKDQETDRVWGLRQGAKDYVTKPVSKDELLTKIKNILGS